MSWVEISGADTTVDFLDQMAGRAGDLEAFIEEIHLQFLSIEKAVFAAEGPGWAPLAPSTLADKQRKGLSERILEATGQMMASFVDPDAEGHVFDVAMTGDGFSVEIGSEYRAATQTGRWADTALAAFHQEGTDRMPARPIIDDVEQLAVTWSALLSDWLLWGTGVPAAAD